MSAWGPVRRARTTLNKSCLMRSSNKFRRSSNNLQTKLKPVDKINPNNKHCKPNYKITLWSKRMKFLKRVSITNNPSKMMKPKEKHNNIHSKNSKKTNWQKCPYTVKARLSKTTNKSSCLQMFKPLSSCPKFSLIMVFHTRGNGLSA